MDDDLFGGRPAMAAVGKLSTKRQVDGFLTQVANALTNGTRAVDASEMFTPGRALSGKLEAFGIQAPKPRRIENRSTARTKQRVLNTGDGGASKTNGFVDLLRDPKVPLRENGMRLILITYDLDTADSILQRWVELGSEQDREWFGVEPGMGGMRDRIELYELGHEDPETGYPGLNPNQPWTCAAAVAATMRILETVCDQKRRPPFLYLDHFQALYERGAKYLAYHEAKLDPTAKMAYHQWGPRTAAAELLEALMFATSTDWLGISGFEPKLDFIPVPRDPDNPKAGYDMVRDVKVPPYFREFRRNFPVKLMNSWTVENEGPRRVREDTKKFWTYVLDSRAPLFPIGHTEETTNRGLSVFFDKERAREDAVAKEVTRPSKEDGTP